MHLFGSSRELLGVSKVPVASLFFQDLFPFHGRHSWNPNQP